MASAATDPQLTDERHEVRGRLERGFVASRDDCLREASRARKLAVLREDLLERLGVEGRKQLARRRALPVAIHAHVERTLRRRVAEAEAARGFVELMRGHAEVEHDPVDLERREIRGDVVETAERGLDQANALAKARRREAGTGFADRLGIEVESDEHAVRARAIENRVGVSAAAQGPVEDHGARLEVEESEGFGEKDGFVVGRGHHCGCLSSMWTVRSPRFASPSFAEEGGGEEEARLAGGAGGECVVREDVGASRDTYLRHVPPSNRAGDPMCPGNTPTSLLESRALQSPQKSYDPGVP